jgi:hypothetical protein
LRQPDCSESRDISQPRSVFEEGVSDNKIIKFPQHPSFDHWQDAYWGVCPQCKRHDHVVNVGHGEHWYVCHRHRVKWCVGENLFSAWLWEEENDPEGYQRRGAAIAGYREITCSQANDAAVAAGLLCAECSNTGRGRDGQPCRIPSHWERWIQDLQRDLGQEWPTE